MSRTVGYARAWWAGENLSAEHAALQAAGVDVIFAGKGRDAEDLVQCLSLLEAGDTLVVTAAARLASSLPGFVQAVADLATRGVVFCSLSEPSLSTAGAPAAAAETLLALETLRGTLVGLRTRQGMLRAEAAGRRPGRPSVMTPERVAVAEELRRQKRSIAHIARVIGVSPSAVQRALAVPA